MVNTTASDQDVLIAEAAICDRAMIVLLNLSQSSEVYGIEFMNPTIDSLRASIVTVTFSAPLRSLHRFRRGVEGGDYVITI
jgi:hypothetical protein